MAKTTKSTEEAKIEAAPVREAEPKVEAKPIESRTDGPIVGADAKTPDPRGQKAERAADQAAGKLG